jgi:hypothetical protein
MQGIKSVKGVTDTKGAPLPVIMLIAALAYPRAAFYF